MLSNTTPVRQVLRGLLLGVPLLAASLVMTGGTASAAVPTPVGLGTATTFAIVAGQGISNTGAGTAITGDIGNSPGSGSQIVGLTCTPAQVTGTIYSVDGAGPTTTCAQNNPGFLTTVTNDARTAFNHTSALPGATALSNPDLAGQTLVSGIYSFGAPASNLSGTVTLDAQGNPNAVWIMQASSSLITSPGSVVQFANLPAGVSAAQLACNVFWTAGSSATIDTTSNFIGTILASASITVNTGATVTGRLLAANAAGAGGSVTLDTDSIVRPPGCAVLPAGTGGFVATAAPAPVVVQPAFTG